MQSRGLAVSSVGRSKCMCRDRRGRLACVGTGESSVKKARGVWGAGEVGLDHWRTQRAVEGVQWRSASSEGLKSREFIFYKGGTCVWRVDGTGAS